MASVVICDAMRTPFGRYGGSAVDCARRRSGCDTDQGAYRAATRRRLGRASTMSFCGCANQAGEDNRNVARMALLLAGLPRQFPASTVNRLCGSSMDAIGIAARAIKSGEAALIDRRRRGEHVACAFRHGQGRSAFSRSHEAGGHDHRLALYQSLAEGEVRRRFHAGNGGECRRGVQDFARRPGRLCAAQPTAHAAAVAGGRKLAEEIVPVTHSAEEGRCAGRGPGRASAPDTSLEALAKLKPRGKAGRHGHCGQCFGHQ